MTADTLFARAFSRIETWMRRHHAEALGRSGSDLAGDELASDAWLRLAWRDSDGVAVCVPTGRVFTLRHDDPPLLVPLAASVAAVHDVARVRREKA